MHRDERVSEHLLLHGGCIAPKQRFRLRVALEQDLVEAVGELRLPVGDKLEAAPQKSDVQRHGFSFSWIAAGAFVA